MKIDSYLITSIAGGSNLIAQAGSQPKFARAVILRNVSGTVTLGGKERGTRPLPVNTDIVLNEVNRAGQSGKYDLSEMILRGVGTTEVLLIDPSND
jgi:hypothetical protein